MSKLQKFLSERADNTHVTLEWKELNYKMRIKDSKQSRFMKPVYNNKSILENVSGKAVSGELLAIMGPTGCGK